MASGILTPQKSDGTIPHAHYTLNPYVGCAFGCTYCYVREMQYGDDAHEKSEEWGNWVHVKKNAVDLLRRAMRRLYDSRVWIGSATDPYQPIERRLGLTRSILETLVMAYPRHVHIQTRSSLVVRDIDVFRRFGDTLSIGVSIPTDDDTVRKVFEPSAPSIRQRLDALHRLHDAGIDVEACIAPLLPCDPERLGRLIKGGARRFWVGEMRYHWTDREMMDRYRAHGWDRWIRPERKSVEADLERIWNETGAEP